MLEAYDRLIKDACSRVYDEAKKTPLDIAQNLTKRLNNTVLLKREDLQPVFSFKIRGAYNKIAGLSAEQRARGVICASAGNHAQGVALAAHRLGLHGVIVMPVTTPEIKVDAVAALGGDVRLHGDSFDQAYAYARKLERENGYVFVHPYDDPEVIAGQGTVAVEILDQHRELCAEGKLSKPIDVIFVPVGGGGLIAGIAAYVKHHQPNIRVIGVEAEGSECLSAAREAGERKVLDRVSLFADGVAVAQVGEETFRIAREYVDEVIIATTDEICAAIKDIFNDTRSIAEPAGALALAGLKNYVAREGCEGHTLIAIDSGANMNFDRLGYIAEHTKIGEKREAIFAVTIPEKAGAFKELCRTIGQRSITEFSYRYSGEKDAHVFVGIALRRGLAERTELKHTLEKDNYAVIDLSDDEMAMLHFRHMVGGHAGLNDERLYRCVFPEKPGALMGFLNALKEAWNISLFHYRYLGIASGEVLVGLQAGETSETDVLDTLATVCEERPEEVIGSNAYQLFLR